MNVASIIPDVVSSGLLLWSDSKERFPEKKTAARTPYCHSKGVQEIPHAKVKEYLDCYTTNPRTMDL